MVSDFVGKFPYTRGLGSDYNQSVICMVSCSGPNPLQGRLRFDRGGYYGVRFCGQISSH